MSAEDLTALLGDLCQFSCLWCNFEIESYCTFCKHMMENHLCKISRYLLQGDAESHAKKLVLTLCRICKAPLPHDSYCIYKHLEKKHPSKKWSLKEQVMEYAASCSTGINKSNRQDFNLMQKCVVTVRMSKFVQHVKDEANKKKVEHVKRESLNGAKSLRVVCFKGKKLPVVATCEIGNLCFFKCFRCQKQSSSLIMLARHRPTCTGSQNVSASQLVKMYIKEARYHQCRLCGDTILCDLYAIGKHLNFQHSMDLTSYMFKKQYKGIGSGLTYLNQYDFKGTVLSTKEMSQVSPHSVTREEANLCQFRCTRCAKNFISMTLLVYHLLKCIGSGSFKPEYVTAAVFHECKICGVYILCDRRILCHHVQAKHGLAIAKYASLSALDGNQTGSRNLKYRTKESLKVKNIPLVPALDQITNPKGSLPDDLTTSSVGNFCQFACDLCDFMCSSWNALRTHKCIRKIRGQDKTIYNVKYVKRARYHKCAICEKVILCDRAIILKHITCSHGHRLKEYLKMNNSRQSVQNKTQAISPGVNQSQHSYSRYKKWARSEGSNIPTTRKCLNLSTFQCDACKLEFSNWGLTKEHLKKCKKEALFRSKYVINAVFHECKICEAKMLCDKLFIWYHIKQHQISAKEYTALHEEKTPPKFVKKTVKIGSETLETSVKVFSSSMSEHSYMFTVPQGGMKDSELTLFVGNLCTFQCIYCQFESDSWTKLSAHVVKNCDGTKKTKWFCGDFVRRAVYHKCYICAKAVLCDEDLIRRHSSDPHGIPLLSNYIRQGPKHIMEHYLKKDSQASLKSYDKCYTKLPPHVSKSMISDKVASGCLFACDKCEQSFGNWDALSHHKRMLHGTPRMRFESKYVKRAQYYQCPLCKSYVLCDVRFLYQHAKSHKITTLKEFSKIGGK